MGLVKNIMRKAGFVHKSDLGRAYKAGMQSRFTSGFASASAQIDRDVKAGLIPVRGRARALAQNNSYVVGYLLRKVVGIAGPEGFNFQWRAKKENGELDDEANNIVESAFKEWSKKQFCTMRGMLSFVQVQHLVIKVWKRDGEFIVRKIQGPSSENKFGFSLDLLEVDDIDETYNVELQNGNIVKMGVELNRWRKPVAFWLKSRTLKDDLSYSNYTVGSRVRVPASEIIFGFDHEHPRQTRAVSPLAQVMLPLYMGDDWENASLINANWSAKLLGYYVKKRLDGTDTFTGDDEGKDEEHITHDFEDGTIEELPFGYEYQNPNREYPSDQHAPFLKSLLRKIAAGVGLSYNSLANDLEGVNFSSLRNGKEEERDNFKLEQVMLREQLLIPIVEAWLKWSLLANAIPGYGPIDYERLNVHHIRGRRWGYIDPLKDVNSFKIAVEEGFKSRKDVIEEYGGNKDEIDIELGKDLKIKKELELGSKANIEIIDVDPDDPTQKTKLTLLAKQ